ncbi:hypothetical protein ACERNI_03315 [Camelimonas sp. ID_303_24]
MAVANAMMAVSVTMPVTMSVAVAMTMAMTSWTGRRRVGHDDGAARRGNRQTGRQQRRADGFAGCNSAEQVLQHDGSPLPDGLPGSGFAPLHAHGSQQRAHRFTAWMIFFWRNSIDGGRPHRQIARKGPAAKGQKPRKTGLKQRPG